MVEGGDSGRARREWMGERVGEINPSRMNNIMDVMYEIFFFIYKHDVQY